MKEDNFEPMEEGAKSKKRGQELRNICKGRL